MRGIVTLIEVTCLVIVGGWLAILGQWWALAGGLLVLFAAQSLIALLTMPGIAFNAPARYLKQRGWGLFAAPFLLLESLYVCVLISLWCLLILHVFVSPADDASLWPLLLWSYAVALGPWAYLARQERQAGVGGPTGFATVLARIAYIATGGAVVFLDLWLFSAAKIFVLVIATGVILQTAFGLARSAAVLKRQRTLAGERLVALDSSGAANSEPS